MDDKKKNLLVIGNGFDLYHGLPTRFSDFFNFIDNFELICSYKLGMIENIKRIDEKKYEFVKNILNFYKENRLKSEILENIKKYIKKTNTKFDNKLFEYWNEYKQIREGMSHENIEWNNFEMILSDLLEEISNIYKSENIKFLLSEQVKKEYSEFLSNINSDGRVHLQDKRDCVLKLFIKKDKDDILSEEEAISNIYKYFKEFRIMLNFYMSYYVNKQKVECYSIDIEKIIKDKDYKILSFNYSDYNNYSLQLRSDENVIYIHGKASGDNYNNKDKYYCNNDIVVGVPDKKFNDKEHIEFQKFFQRIMFETKTIGENDIRLFDKAYFFGHSLHKLDESILKLIFDNAGKNKVTPHIVIYCKDDFDKKQKILNILDWYDKEIFIKRMSSKEIVFEEIKESIRYDMMYKNMYIPERGE